MNCVPYGPHIIPITLSTFGEAIRKVLSHIGLGNNPIVNARYGQFVKIWWFDGIGVLLLQQGLLMYPKFLQKGSCKMILRWSKKASIAKRLVNIYDLVSLIMLNTVKLTLSRPSIQYCRWRADAFAPILSASHTDIKVPFMIKHMQWYPWIVHLGMDKVLIINVPLTCLNLNICDETDNVSSVKDLNSTNFGWNHMNNTYRFSNWSW